MRKLNDKKRSEPANRREALERGIRDIDRGLGVGWSRRGQSPAARPCHQAARPRRTSERVRKVGVMTDPMILILKSQTL